MRRCYLVCYDIRDPKRLRRVFETLKGYGEHWQFSIFFCRLKDIDRVRMQSALESVMNLKKDQTVIIDMGGSEQAARDAVVVLGTPLPEQDDGMVVV